MKQFKRHGCGGGSNIAPVVEADKMDFEGQPTLTHGPHHGHPLGHHGHHGKDHKHHGKDHKHSHDKIEKKEHKRQKKLFKLMHKTHKHGPHGFGGHHGFGHHGPHGFGSHHGFGGRHGGPGCQFENMTSTATAQGESTWSPTVKCQETETEYITIVELPGMKKEQINIEVKGRKLIISGEKLVGFPLGKFSTKIKAPRDTNIQTTKAAFQDSILTLTTPKIIQETHKICIQ
eukprot:gene3670-4224_t